MWFFLLIHRGEENRVRVVCCCLRRKRRNDLLKYRKKGKLAMPRRRSKGEKQMPERGRGVGGETNCKDLGMNPIMLREILSMVWFFLKFWCCGSCSDWKNVWLWFSEVIQSLFCSDFLQSDLNHVTAIQNLWFLF